MRSITKPTELLESFFTQPNDSRTCLWINPSKSNSHSSPSQHASKRPAVPRHLSTSHRPAGTEKKLSPHGRQINDEPAWSGGQKGSSSQARADAARDTRSPPPAVYDRAARLAANRLDRAVRIYVMCARGKTDSGARVACTKRSEICLRGEGASVYTTRASALDAVYCRCPVGCGTVENERMSFLLGCGAWGCSPEWNRSEWVGRARDFCCWLYIRGHEKWIVRVKCQFCGDLVIRFDD